MFRTLHDHARVDGHGRAIDQTIRNRKPESLCDPLAGGTKLRRARARAFARYQPNVCRAAS